MREYFFLGDYIPLSLLVTSKAGCTWIILSFFRMLLHSQRCVRPFRFQHLEVLNAQAFRSVLAWGTSMLRLYCCGVIPRVGLIPLDATNAVTADLSRHTQPRPHHSDMSDLHSELASAAL